MKLSYWEYKTWLSNIDFTVIGSGIVGLNCAIHLKERFPKSKVLVLEKGMLPQGASTKNAGFACFGSISEILSDLQNHSEGEVFDLVKQRWHGLQFLRELLGDVNIGFHRWGGHEIFLETDRELFENCQMKLPLANELLTPIFGEAPFQTTENCFAFQNIHSKYITHQFEGQIETGNMMASLLDLAQSKGIRILNSIEVKSFEETGGGVLLQLNDFEFKTNRLFVTTNGFSRTLLDEDVAPARAQVLITEPIENLHIKGTFHFDVGYYYFRNIDNRILFGGGRNLDFQTEATTAFGQTELIQMELERLLGQVILPNTPFEIDQRWSGIMGVGKQKKPVVKQLSNHVYCGVRLGGMGIAIGSLIGKDLARLA